MKLVTLSVALLAASVVGAFSQNHPAPMGSQGQPEGQNHPFCLNDTSSGSTNCSFASMAQCEQARKGLSSGTCAVNTPLTTGQAPSTRPTEYNK